MGEDSVVAIVGVINQCVVAEPVPQPIDVKDRMRLVCWTLYVTKAVTHHWPVGLLKGYNNVSLAARPVQLPALASD